MSRSLPLLASVLLLAGCSAAESPDSQPFATVAESATSADSLGGCALTDINPSPQPNTEVKFCDGTWAHTDIMYTEGDAFYHFDGAWNRIESSVDTQREVACYNIPKLEEQGAPREITGVMASCES